MNKIRKQGNEMDIKKNYKRKCKQLAKILLLSITNDINPKNICQEINEKYHTKSFEKLLKQYFLNDEYLKIICNDTNINSTITSNRELYVIKEICFVYAMKKYYKLNK